jgi:hypothetical protein
MLIASLYLPPSLPSSLSPFLPVQEGGGPQEEARGPGAEGGGDLAPVPGEAGGGEPPHRRGRAQDPRPGEGREGDDRAAEENTDLATEGKLAPLCVCLCVSRCVSVSLSLRVSLSVYYSAHPPSVNLRV